MWKKLCGWLCICMAMLCCGAYGQTAEEAGNAAPLKFDEKLLWIQVGNQIKDVDADMLRLIEECGFGKVVLLHSSINEQGYFPVLNSIVRRCHERGIQVSVGTLVFKDTFQKRYWEKNPDLRHCDKEGKYSENKYYHYQICPNNPRNHEYIASYMYRKALESGADEVHIDYEISPCYCPYCVTAFSDDTGLDARQLSNTDPRWLTWRSRKTRDFFEILARKCRSMDERRIAVSATAPIIGHAGGFSAYDTDLRYEDLTMYVDEFQPMVYISVKNPPEQAGTRYESIAIRVIGRPVIPGIIINEEFTTEIKTADRVAQELRSLKEKGAKGVAIFEVRYINDELKELLKNL